MKNKRTVLLLNLFLKRRALPKEKSSQKAKVVAILVFAGVMVAAAMMVSPAGAQSASVNVYDAPLKFISPGKAYVAYNITYQENQSDTTGANLTWFNVTGMNATIPNRANINDIINVSVWNATTMTCLGYDDDAPFNVSLNNETVANNSTYNLTIIITTNGTMDTGDWFRNVSINATLYDNETVGGLAANDSEPERIIRVEINEIMYQPQDVQGGDPTNEWVELHNTNTTDPINVSGWILNTTGQEITIPTPTNIEPNGYLIIANNSTSFESYYRWVNTSLVICNGTIGLANESDTVVLKNSTGAEIDNVTYDQSWGADGNGKTLERNGNEYVVEQRDMWSESNSYAGTPLDTNSIIDTEPYIVDYFPHDTSPTSLTYTVANFGVNLSQAANVTVYVNGQVFYANISAGWYNFSIYTGALGLGHWNVTATLSGSPVHDTMEWDLDCEGVWVDTYDSPETLVSPGKSYIAYNITFTANGSDTAWTNLSWFNITGMNTTFTNLGDVYDISNVSVILNTTGENIVDYSASDVPNPTSFPIAVNLSNTGTGNDTVNQTVILSVYLTINNSAPIDPWDGTNISINASLYAWGNTSSSWTWGSTNNTNDPAPELIAYKSVEDPTDAVIMWNETTYYPDSVARISVFDPDYNMTASGGEVSKQTIVVRAWTDTAGNATSGYEEVELVETANESYWFNGTVTFSTTATSHANDVLAVRHGDRIYVQIRDNQDQYGATTLRNATAWFNFTRAGTVALNKTTYNTSEVAKVTVSDKDENKDSTKIETINVSVNSTTDPTGITLTLTETTISSGKFEGTFNFTTTGNSSGTTLKVTINATHTVNETINVTYYDEKTAAGTAENITVNATFYGRWTGDVSLNQTVYLNNTAIRVNLTEPDLNLNTSGFDNLTSAGNYTLILVNTTNTTVLANSSLLFSGSYDTENITMINETGIDTGEFFNDTIKLYTTTVNINGHWSNASDNGSLYVLPGQGFSVVYLDFADEYGTNCSGNYNRSVTVLKTYATASTYQTAATSVWWNGSGNITDTGAAEYNVTGGDVWGNDTVVRISVADADGGGTTTNPNVNDTIYVLVNSTAPDAGEINISLTETGPNTGIFNGTLYFGTESDAATRTIKVNDSTYKLINTTIWVNFKDTKNVTANVTWSNVSFTHWWTVNGTAKVYNGTVNGTDSSPAIFYNTTTATVYVEDPDRNNDTAVYNNFTVTIVSAYTNGTQIDTLTLIMNETGNNTGVFYNASLNFSEAGDPLKLNVSDGCYINVSYQDTNTSLGNASTWFNYTYGTYKKTRTGTVGLWELNPTVGESGNITLTDYDRNVTAGYDTVDVYVWSNTTGEAGKITITLNETGPTTGIFNGTLRFSTEETNATLNQIKVSDGDNITIRYEDPLNISGLQETIINSSAWVSVHYTGTIAFDKPTYNPTETALITLTDQDLNADSAIAETQTVNVNSSAYPTGITVTLKETGANTGVFNRTITFTTAGPANESGRIINVTVGGTINVTYVDAVNETGSQVNVTANASIVKATVDSLSLDKAYYNETTTATINVTDADLNTDTDLAEVYYADKATYSNVNVNSSSDLTGFNVSIEESGPNTGIFIGTFTLNTTIASSDTTNKILKVANNDTINVTYINADNETGQQETIVTTARFDNLAPVITNLSRDVSPAKEDTVVTITVDVNDNISGLAETPTVTVNDNAATFVSASNNTYTYNYTVSVNDTEGYATVNVSATDNATNTATSSNATLFVIDLSAPTFSNRTPAESEVVGKNTTISVNYFDAYSSINISSVVMKVNGEDVTANATGTATGVSYAATNLPDGTNNASVYVEDELGHSNTTLWNFTVDEVAPRITDMIPDKTNDTTPTIGATIYDNETGVNESTIVLKVDGLTIPSTAWTFTYDSANKTGELRYTPTTMSYGEGVHTVDLSVKDNAGLEASASWNFTVDLTNPTVSVSVDKSEVNVSENVTITVTATDTVTTAENLTVTVTVDTTSVELTRDGSNWSGIWNTTTPGNYTVTAKATDEAGNSVTDTTTVEVIPVAAKNFSVSITPSSITVNESTSVTVNVTDNATGLAVEGATVNLSGCGYTNETLTNATGIATFEVNATETGNITVTVSKEGYNPKEETITVTPVDWNPWDDDGVVTTEEIQEAVNYWVTDTPINGHLITTPEIQELVYMWLTT